MYQPKFQITPALAKALMSIEADRQLFTSYALDVKKLTGVRETARAAATHFSTQLDGNLLTLDEVADVIKGAHLTGREAAEKEVRLYSQALEELERLAGSVQSLSEENIKRIYAFVVGSALKASEYREDQKVLQNSAPGALPYTPPEAEVVAELMVELVTWVNEQLSSRELPIPLIAGLKHARNFE